MSEKSIQDKLRKSLIFVTGSNIIGAIVFFVAYFFTKEILLLVAAIFVFIAGIVFIFAVKRIEKKLINILNPIGQEHKND